MTEPLVQTSKDTLPTVRRESWEPVLVQVFRDADTGDRIRPARLLTRQMPVGELARREAGCPNECGQTQV